MLKKYLHSSPCSVICNLLLIYVIYMICRLEFVALNWQLFSADLNGALVWRMLAGALRFDTSAILYTNLLYMVVVMLPLHYKEKNVTATVAKWCYVIPNALAVVVNLADSVYFPYSMRRTTMTIFKEFGDNTNNADVIGIELVNHWYLVLLAAVLIFAIYKCYVATTLPDLAGKAAKRSYYIRRGIAFVIAVPVIIMGLRGNRLGHINRPISTILANEYIDKPEQAGIVVNTTFSLIRSSTKSDIKVPAFYADLAAAESVFSPVHHPADSLVRRDKNVVIILLESFSEEFIGAMRREQAAADYTGTLTPFVDSLYSVSLTYEQTFANGWMSTDGIPLVQASLPKMFNGYNTSQFALNETPGIAKELANRGYHAAYFHGAEDASLGLKGSARSTGITDYNGMEEYIADARFGGKADYDGTWGIWDEQFMQYFCTRLGEMQQPFIATLFTLNSHHPFNLPDKYKDTFGATDPKHPVKGTIRYTDYSLRRFFESAARQPWYANTIFVVTADHCYHNIIRDSYRNAAGQFRVPILFFDPSGELPRGVKPGIAQQIDIMPTLLGYLGYDRDYVAYGKDLLATDADSTWAFQFQDVPQYIKGDYLIQMANFKLSAVYRFRDDFSLRNNLLESGDYDKAYVGQMQRELEAILQSADTRLRTNTLRQTKIDKK